MDNSAETGHINDDLLDRYAMGGLSADALHPIEEHLLSCTECQSRLRESDEFVHLFTQAASQIEFRKAPWWKRIPQFRVNPLWVAALAMMAVAAPVVRTWSRAHQAPEQELFMQSLRGPGENARVAAGRPVRLVFDLQSTSGNCKLKILNTDGGAVQDTRTSPVGNRPAASVAGLAPGDYWARLYCGSDSELTAEYSLNAK